MTAHSWMLVWTLPLATRMTAGVSCTGQYSDKSPTVASKSLHLAVLFIVQMSAEGHGNEEGRAETSALREKADVAGLASDVRSRSPRRMNVAYTADFLVVGKSGSAPPLPSSSL